MNKAEQEKWDAAYEEAYPGNFKDIAKTAREALCMASTHDPDHAKELKELRRRVDVLERQMQRIGAPQYRVVRKGTN